jgi:hypothetical protein
MPLKDGQFPGMNRKMSVKFKLKLQQFKTFKKLSEINLKMNFAPMKLMVLRSLYSYFQM